MLPSRHASVHPVAHPVRAGPAPAESASAPLARLERQLLRGGPKLGPERVLADRVFSVVARTICATADTTLDGDDTSDPAPVDGLTATEALGSPPGAPVVTAASPPGPRTAASPHAACQTEADRLPATATSRAVRPVSSVHPVVRPLGRVGATGPATLPLHLQAASQRRGLGRAVVLGVVLAVLVVALTLGLLGVPPRTSLNSAGTQAAARPDREAETTEPARRVQR